MDKVKTARRLTLAAQSALVLLATNMSRAAESTKEFARAVPGDPLDDFNRSRQDARRQRASRRQRTRGNSLGTIGYAQNPAGTKLGRKAAKGQIGITAIR